MEGREGILGSGNGRSKCWEKRKLKACLGQSGGPRWVEVEALGGGKRIDLTGLRSDIILRTLGKMAGAGVGLIWSLMLEKMPLSASQPRHRPPTFRSVGAQVRKQLSGPMGWELCRLLAMSWETTLLICKASLGALSVCCELECGGHVIQDGDTVGDEA